MSNEIFDYEELMERVQDDKELLLELLELYIEDFKQKRVSLDDYVKNQDFENIRGVAHSLKGASGNISAKALREILLQLEQKGKDETMDGVEDLLDQLDKGFEELNNHLTDIKEKLQEQ
jgi:HPt (histidine-containing phosphotransfer) domain-containing protein